MNKRIDMIGKNYLSIKHSIKRNLLIIIFQYNKPIL